MNTYGMVHVGVVLPGGPPGLGDIWMSEALIAQKGEAEVRRLVRQTFKAAYAKQDRERRRQAALRKEPT